VINSVKYLLEYQSKFSMMFSGCWWQHRTCAASNTDLVVVCRSVL